MKKHAFSLDETLLTSVYLFFNFRKFMGVPCSSLCLRTSIPVSCCWSVIPVSTVFWLWFGLERGHYSHLVRFARGRGIVSFLVCQGKIYGCLISDKSLFHILTSRFECRYVWLLRCWIYICQNDRGIVKWKWWCVLNFSRSLGLSILEVSSYRTVENIFTLHK